MVALLIMLTTWVALAAAAPWTEQSLPEPPTVSRRDDPVTVLKRRRTHNCNDNRNTKGIEAQAWADAGELAKAAHEWDPKNKWQTAMDLYMGPDSTDSSYSYKISSALDNQNKIHNPNWIFPEAVVDIYCGDTHPDKKICVLKPNPRDPKGPRVTPFASSWVVRGTFYNSYNVVLCPRFFQEKVSLQSLLNDFKSGKQNGGNATAYKSSWGHTIFHELMHLDPIIAGDEVWDVAYGACPARKLANNNGCGSTGDAKNPRWKPPGWSHDRQGPATSVNNADSWAFFADAVYFQKAFKYLSPGEPDNDCGIWSVSNANIANWAPLSVQGTREPDVHVNQTKKSPEPLTADETPPDPPSVPRLPYEAIVTPEGLATPFNAKAYFATFTPKPSPSSSAHSSSHASASSSTSRSSSSSGSPSRSSSGSSARSSSRLSSGSSSRSTSSSSSRSSSRTSPTPSSGPSSRLSGSSPKSTSMSSSRSTTRSTSSSSSSSSPRPSSGPSWRSSSGSSSAARSTTSPPSSSSATPSSSAGNYCSGNQVNGNCIDGKIPTPTGGIGCLRPAVNGGNKNHLRYNTASAASAASTYCSNLINDKIVLDKDNTSPKPGSAPGAENDGKISLTVSYTDDYCVNSISRGKVDFAALGQQQCEMNFSQFGQLCGEDEAFPKYDKDYTGMGGVAGFECAIWSVEGLPGSG